LSILTSDLEAQKTFQHREFKKNLREFKRM